MAHGNATRKLGVESLEERQNPSTMLGTAPGDIYAHAASGSTFDPAEAMRRLADPRLEQSGGGHTLTSHDPGGRPGEKVVLQVILHVTGHGTGIKDQNVVFTINGTRLTTHTDGSGQAQVEYTIPRNTRPGDHISFTAQASGLTVYPRINVRR